VELLIKNQSTVVQSKALAKIKEEQGSSGTNPCSNGDAMDGYEADQTMNQTFMTLNSKEAQQDEGAAATHCEQGDSH